MSYTYTEQKGDGTTRTFPFGFAGEDKGYIRATDILVETSATGLDYVTSNGWSLSGTNQITFLTPPASGLFVRIRRVVDKNKPFAKFDRSVTLDMLSLNNTFVQTLQVIQEIMDGFFPTNFFFKGDISMGGHRIKDVQDGFEQFDAINKNQFDVEVHRNDRQDQEIAGLKSSMTSGTAHRTIPWYYKATGGETTISPPFKFDGCLVFINGVFQIEEAGAYTVSNSVLTFAEPLLVGYEVLILMGSRMAPPINDERKEVSFDVVGGETTVTLPEDAGRMEVYLDGLYQPLGTILVVNLRTIQFSEPLPKCTVTVKYQPTI